MTKPRGQHVARAPPPGASPRRSSFLPGEKAAAIASLPALRARPQADGPSSRLEGVAPRRPPPSWTRGAVVAPTPTPSRTTAPPSSFPAATRGGAAFRASREAVVDVCPSFWARPRPPPDPVLEQGGSRLLFFLGRSRPARQLRSRTRRRPSRPVSGRGPPRPSANLLPGHDIPCS